MKKLQSAILELHRLETSSSKGWLSGFDPRGRVLLCLLFLIAVLMVPVSAPGKLLWFFIYPIFMATAADLSFGKVFLKSLWILPFAAVIGIFNPILETAPAFTLSGVTVTQGWLSFAGILLRGLLSMQAVIVLVEAVGFYPLTTALGKIGFPDFLTTQLLMVYRYLSVLLQEALTMNRAIAARGYGRESFPLKMWATVIGQLLLRTVDRAERIHRAMLARGYNGTMPELGKAMKWKTSDSVTFCSIAALIAILYFFNPQQFFA